MKLPTITLLILTVAVILLSLTALSLVDSNVDLAKRVDALERRETFLGRDVNGNEVWGSARTTVALPATQALEGTLQKH